VLTKRYATWDGLLDYCRRAANPVGRLVLRVGGETDERLDRASDAMCTALRLAGLWRDVARDWKRGRVYVPSEDLAAFSAAETDLDSGSINEAWRSVLAEMAGRTRTLFSDGRAVCDGVTGRFRLGLRVTWLGGLTVLERLERSGFDVFRDRPTVRRVDAPLLLWQAFTWRSSS